MPLIDSKNKIIYYLPRKVGSSTIETILLKLLDEKSKQTSEGVYKHANFKSFTKTEIEKDYKKIIFLRNPTDQIISWFFWKYRFRISKIKKNKKRIILLFFKTFRLLLHSNDEFYNYKYDMVFYFEDYSTTFKNFLKETYQDGHIVFDTIFNSQDKTLKKDITNKTVKQEILKRMNQNHKNIIQNHFKKFSLFDRYYK